MNMRAAFLEVVNDALRFMIWAPGADHPRTLGPDDLRAAQASGKPFARKFDLGRDPGLLPVLAPAELDVLTAAPAR